MHSQYDPGKVKVAGTAANGWDYVVQGEGADRKIFFDRDGNGKFDLIMARNAVTGDWEYNDGDTDGWQPFDAMNSNENGWIGDAWDGVDSDPSDDNPVAP